MKSIFTILFVFAILSLHAQSKTTEALAKKYDAQSFFFYNNTLRMLNQAEDPAFDDIIKDIEKMKFLMIKKNAKSVAYKQVVSDYKAEAFEEVMTSRHEGKNFDVFLKEKDKKTTGMLVLINDSSNLFVLDIVGSIALNKITSLYNTLDKSADFGKKIHDFANDTKD
jgi:hypothetical protein